MSKLNLKFLRKSLEAYSSRLQFLALAPLVEAATFAKPPETISSGQDVITAVENVSGFLFKIFMALAVVFIIIAALFYLTAAGNQTQLDKAKNILIYSIVAIVIALIAGGIVQFVGDVGNVPVP